MATLGVNPSKRTRNRLASERGRSGPSSPDLAGATRYALQRLARDLSPMLTFHTLGHTLDDVVPAVERLAMVEGIRGDALLVLRTAAYFHDLGFVKLRRGHEELGAALAAKVLPTFGYAAALIGRIHAAILATRLPQAPRTRVEAVLAERIWMCRGALISWHAIRRYARNSSRMGCTAPMRRGMAGR